MRLASAVALSAILVATPSLLTPSFAQDAAAPPAAGAPAEAPSPTPPEAPTPPTAPAPEPEPTITAADVGPTVDRDLWCAIALSLAARSAEMRADPSAAMTDQEASQVFFTSVVVAMQSNGNSEAQFNQLSGTYTQRMLDPFTSAEGGFTRSECEAAIPEAQAAIDAAAAAAAEAQPAPDAAPPAAPSTPDAPAGDAPAADAPATDGAAGAAGPDAGAATPSQ